MFVRFAHLDVKPDRWTEAVDTFRQSIFPLLEKEPGFMRVVLTGDGSGKAIMMTMWQTEAHVRTYEASGEAERLVAPFREMFASPPEVVGYPVVFDREF